MEEQLLKPANIAEILQVSKAQAYNLLKRGEIPVIRIGTLVRVRPQDLKGYIEAKSRQNNVEEPKPKSSIPLSREAEAY
jgi:excisionase family DNA binding protein